MDFFFETEHLRVRRFRAEDARCLFELHLDGEVKKWIPNESYADLKEAQEAIEFFMDRVNGGKLPCVLAAEEKETGCLIGDTGINEVEGKLDEVEIGYVIGESYRGKGYATELLGAMTKFAVSTFGISTLYGRVMRGNDASVRVLEKNGYVLTGEEFGAEDDPYGNGMLIYRVDRSADL